MMPEQLINTTDIGVWCGLDVGKEEHHACALDKDRTRLFDKPLPQDEAKLREVFTRLQTHGRVLVIVDQPNTIGALPVAGARNAGCEVAYLPGLAMRKAAQLMPEDTKTDARDAFVIATTTLRMPDTLRAVDRDNEVLASLKVLAGYDNNLARQSTRSINRLRALLLQIHPALQPLCPTTPPRRQSPRSFNRLRSLLLQIHPALERVFAGTRLTNHLCLDLLARYEAPTALAKAGPAASEGLGAQDQTPRC